MKSLVVACCLGFTLLNLPSRIIAGPALIPVPQKMQFEPGVFRLQGSSSKAGTRIVVEPALRGIGEYLAGILHTSTGIAIPVVESSMAGRGDILLTTHDSSEMPGESYNLSVARELVTIRGSQPAGVFYGVQTLLQLLPPEVFASKAVPGMKWEIPCVEIADQPRFAWRGIMLDVSRHFFSPKEIEQVLELMAHYKLNTFHWHLVDDQGWRIEIKKYPKLTQVGAWRGSIAFGQDPRASSAYGVDGRYGGFYTQDEIREVVAYAAARQITIVPEIEMPGHSSAALAAYPELSCSGEPYDLDATHRPGVYCAGKEETFAFLQDVLSEVFELFPCKYVHIGGDEVNKQNWKACPKCQERLKSENLKNEEELQSYFIRRMEKFVNAHGRTLIGWSEILQGGLAQNAVVMDWIGGAREAASAGHDVVMSPNKFCYLNYYQSPDRSLEPRAQSGYSSLQHVYSFEPIPTDIAAEAAAHILGAQANFWTEYIASPRHLQYMMFPRLAALAEVAWSPKETRNWERFQACLSVDERRLNEEGVNYRREFFTSVGSWSPERLARSDGKSIEWDLGAQLRLPGQYHFIFEQSGGPALKLSGAALLENGVEIFQDQHGGIAGAPPKGPVYVLKLPVLKSGAHYKLQARLMPESSRNSKGIVSCAWHPLEPFVSITNKYISASVSLEFPGFHGLALDSLGKEHFPQVHILSPVKPWKPTVTEQHGSKFEYLTPVRTSGARWTIEIKNKEIEMRSHWSEDAPPEPLVLEADNSVCHVTLLGKIRSDGSIQLPAVLHFPDQGSFRISATGSGSLDYSTSEGNMTSRQAKSVKVTFPPATRGNPIVTYRLDVEAIYPKFPGIEKDARFDGFRRNWLNILQLSPYWRTLANHSASDTCAFCYYEYADIAAATPPLAHGIVALDLIRQTLERIISGANAYGMPGHGAFPEFAADALPSLVIAAHHYVVGTKDKAWLTANYEHVKDWTDKMLATDRDGNGLIEYTLSGNSGSWPEHLKYRPANWWDTIGFGHEDAYANALAYRALTGMAELAGLENRADDQAKYHAAADKLRSAYFDAFYNPATGVLAGWRSAEGQLHDYYFLWVNGIAIHCGLVPRDKANAIMDRLLEKMKEVGYSRFDLGLPGNLVPVARKDYVDHNPRFGGGHREDNTDDFQIYENGGATACFAYYTLAALYDLGRVEDGDRLLFPMLESFAKGDFQGRGANGLSKDWRAWDGTCWGYEGFLSDNYYALLAVLDREAALRRMGSKEHRR